MYWTNIIVLSLPEWIIICYFFFIHPLDRHSNRLYKRTKGKDHQSHGRATAPHDFWNQFFDATRFFLPKFFWILYLVFKLIIPAQLITNGGSRYYFHLFFQYCRTLKEKESLCQAPFPFPLAYTAWQKVKAVSLPFFPLQGLIPLETKMNKRYTKYLMRIRDTEEKNYRGWKIEKSLRACGEDITHTTSNSNQTGPSLLSSWTPVS